jgi:hypothetical protein
MNELILYAAPERRVDPPTCSWRLRILRVMFLHMTYIFRMTTCMPPLGFLARSPGQTCLHLFLHVYTPDIHCRLFLAFTKTPASSS